MDGLDRLNAKDFVGLHLHISLIDERELDGVLLALDNRPNLLIANTFETSRQRIKNKEFNTVRRSLGLVSIPYETIHSIKTETKELEKLVDYVSQVV